MRQYFGPAFWLGVATGVALKASAAPESIATLMNRQQQVRAGRESFVRNCIGCHGTNADGQGPAAAFLSPKPRNLVEGSFKFRSTPAGSLPTEEDLLRTIEQGVPRSSMPPFRALPHPEKRALVAYLQSLRPDWSEMKGASYAIPDPPPDIFAKKETLLASAARGYVVYKEACLTCHGERGLGDGEGSVGLVDGEGQTLLPANFTRRNLKSGPTPKDVYRTILTGLDGTPMPGFADVYSDAQRWDLVAYVLVRRGQGAGLYPADLDLSFANPTAKTR